MSELREATLVYAIRDNQVWLAMKKRGFGSDKWNGFGGKVDKSETLAQAAVREFKEESTADILEQNLIKKGFLDFYFSENPKYNQRVHVFLVKEWDGAIRETEEMKPKLFSFDDLPLDSMWVTDKDWLPLVLREQEVQATITFSGDDVNEQVTKIDFEKPQDYQPTTF